MKKYIFSIVMLLSATILQAQSNSQFTIHDSQLSTVNCQLSTKLDSLIATSPLLETTQLGLMVWDLTADSVLYAYNHRQRMRPASTMKLLTAITMLDLYGGNYQFTTEVRYNGEIAGRTLVGDLICVGCMDPSFDNGDMNYLVDRIRVAGIDTICGRIVADKSMKDTLLLGQGWCWDDDNPCLSALLLNRKDNFVNRLTTLLTDVGVVIMDRGTLNIEHGTLNIEHGTLNMENSPLSTINSPLSTVHSPLNEILTRMMKQSDNLYAEAIFYHIALSIARPATQKNARTVVRQLIQRLGFDPAQYTVADGSGLSLYNYLSPELLTAFLRHAWRNESIRRHLEPSLPIAGIDGTLKDRMKNTAAYRNVRAKTGTLTGISSLAGYATAANGHQLAFAIINQGIVKAKDGKAFQDKVCALLCGE
ncbi:MAG: D-alanyl-D-alanine carboxypeptidase/D-alanyl-D-alanine-endopeptidase [Prevotella sp.]|nr:D-alanyl-D-alanine carboxypeptidase/D-alanyl-D-alanine-endopeptidase [Prevotella sp.]